MTDMTSIDMAPFLERHVRRNRLVFVTAILASLMMSVVIFVKGAPEAGWTWFFAILFTPVSLVGWYGFGELMMLGHLRTSSRDGSKRAGTDDVRNSVRIAGAGFAFSLVFTATLIIEQALWVPFVFGYRIPMGVWIVRGIMVAVGAATIYLGNLWPRMPTARGPGQSAAIRMKLNRLSGWVMVIVGLLIMLLGLFLPRLHS